MTPPTTPKPPHLSTALFYDPLTRKDPTPTAQIVTAQKVGEHLEDDLDGGPTDTTLTFALDGKDYEIDLSDANAEKLREALRSFVAAARKAPVGTTGRRKRTTGTSSSPGETAAIRAWAKEHGHEVSDRGRIHLSVKDAYYAAHWPPSQA